MAAAQLAGAAGPSDPSIILDTMAAAVADCKAQTRALEERKAALLVELATISSRAGDLAITITDTSALATFAGAIDVSDVEAATLSARDGSLAIATLENHSTFLDQTLVQSQLRGILSDFQQLVASLVTLRNR